MYYSKINKHDIANGDGVRVTLFVSGCTNHCKNCFQPQTWDFCYGKQFTKSTEDELMDALSKPYIKGLTILGGEPMEPRNQWWLSPFLSRIRDMLPDKDIWCYTGFTYEQLTTDGTYCRCYWTDELLKKIDYLVDGRFVDELKDISLRFRGSSNQRIIDLKRTREENSIVLYQDKPIYTKSHN